MMSELLEHGESQHPLEAAKAYLIEHGFDEDEAKNILGAIKANSQERLLEVAPKWIEYCAQIKSDYDTFIFGASKGFLEVEYDDNDELIVSFKKPEEHDNFADMGVAG